MQTFLPYPSFTDSLKCLDYRRLGKQRLEAYGIIGLLTNFEFTKHTDKEKAYLSRRFLKHPAVLMWAGYVPALISYYNRSLAIWVSRGYINTMPCIYRVLEDYNQGYPRWFGLEIFHSSHRANLLRKDSNYYGVYGWKEKPSDVYYWPRDWFEEG